VQVQGQEASRDKWNAFENYKINSHYPLEVTKICQIPSAGSGWKAGLKQFLYSDPSCNWIGPSLPGSFGTVESPFVGLLKLNDTSVGFGHFVPEPAGLDDVVARGLREILYNIKPDLSLVNSIIELRDFRSFGRTVARVQKNMDVVGKQLSKLPNFGRELFPKNGKLRTLISLVGAVSDVFLQMQFNILPLDSDLKSIQETIRTVRRRVNRLLSEDEVIKVHHFNMDFSDYYRDSRDETPSYSVSTAANGLIPTYQRWYARQYRDVKYTSRKVHVQVKYSKTFTEWQRQNALLLGYLDALGVVLDPSIAWNATRWTFVIDWLVGVSNYLSQFSIPNLNPVTVIHNSLWSLKVVRNTTVHSRYHLGAGSPTTTGPVRVCTHIEEAYKRSPSIRRTLETLQTSSLNLKEFTLASALAASRLK
jgi:hypothetical protein